MEFPTAYSNGGRICRIYTLTAGQDRPIHGAYRAGSGWIPVTWTEDGYLLSPQNQSDLDISLWLVKYKQSQYDQQEEQEVKAVSADTFGQAF